MVDYEYYIGSYYGDLVNSKREFEKLRIQCEILVNRYTYGRARLVEDEYIKNIVKITICQLIDLQKQSENQGNLKSESIDDISYTYELRSEDDFYNRKFDIIENNLIATGLMYRGVR